MKRVINIAIYAQHQLLSDGLTALLAEQSNVKVTGVFTSQDAAGICPDVIISDTYGGYKGIEQVRNISAQWPKANVLVISPIRDKYYIGQMLKIGSKGYFNIAQPFDLLKEALKMLAAGRVYLCPMSREVVVEQYVHSFIRSDQTKPLEPLEREIVRLLTEGKTSREIGIIVDKNSKTIDTYRRQIFRKLGINSTAELVKYAIRSGITTL